ncbi:MAG TPA: short-chain dehydrogenase/reductase, partial [Chryseobacterium sp.]
TLIEPNGYETDFGVSSAVQSKSLPQYDAVKTALQEGNKKEDYGVPEATSEAVLKLVDAENPPLRLLLGKAGVQWTKYAYGERLKIWDEWQDVSEAAHGK